MNFKRIAIIAAGLALCFGAFAQDRSLSRHPFAYVGEWDTRHPEKQTMYIVRDGKVTFEFSLPMKDELGRIQEFDDVRVMENGNICYAAMSQIGIVDKDGKQVWKYVCPQGTESHSCQPMGPDMVYFALNGVPGKIMIWNTKEDKLVKEIVVPTKGTSTHGQFRHVRMTSEGNFVTGLINEKEVVEINDKGEIVKSIPGQKAWHVDKLANGNYLIGGDEQGYVREFDKNGKLVWELTQKDVNFPLYNLQTATRLANGNTLITSWVAGKDQSVWPTSVQFFEVTPAKEVVWQVSSWENPDLGPCTYLDILDEPKQMAGGPMGMAPNGQRPPQGAPGMGPGGQPRQMSNPRHDDGTPKMTNDEVNKPLGVAKGIHPGRVAWIHDPGVATWDGETGMWHEPRWNNQAKADEMIVEGVKTVTGAKNAKKAWAALFKYFNKTHNRGNAGYKPGEKIAIKLNINNSFDYVDNEQLNSSPYVTLALLRSLVNDGGVRQEDITVCEPSRYITDQLYNLCHSEFPDVHYVDNVGENGREKADYYDNAIPYTPGHGESNKGLAKCIVDATYLINSALLKIHTGPGVTLTAKNWYGVTSINKEWRKNSHNGINQDKRNGTPKYSSQVDFIGHKDVGGKCMLYLIDGTYGSRDVNGKPDPKWQKAPFNGDWACSIIMSQDALAGDSVALDMLASEWPEVGSLPYCDLYLVEAASLPNPPSGVSYDPESDGQPLTEPLGITEHWNADHKYTAIDLVYKKLQ